VTGATSVRGYDGVLMQKSPAYDMARRMRTAESFEIDVEAARVV
jgi:hypothetical protein